MAFIQPTHSSISRHWVQASSRNWVTLKKPLLSDLSRKVHTCMRAITVNKDNDLAAPITDCKERQSLLSDCASNRLSTVN